MLRNASPITALSRALMTATLAIALNAALLGSLLNQPTRGQSLLLAEHPVAVPVMVGHLASASIAAGFKASFGHVARDLRHAQRNVVRSIHHGARNVSARLPWSDTASNATPPCVG